MVLIVIDSVSNLLALHVSKPDVLVSDGAEDRYEGTQYSEHAEKIKAGIKVIQEKKGKCEPRSQRISL